MGRRRMLRKWCSGSLAALAAAAIFLATPTIEARPGSPSRPNGEPALTLEQAAKQVERRTGGRILSAKVAGQRYVFRVLTPEGRVITVSVRADKARSRR